MSTFDPNNLRMLSPDTEDWNNRIQDLSWPNQECSVYGVLLYPKKGISKNRLDTEVTDYISSKYSFSHGSLEELIIKQRGENWAVVYHITAWYNHFDLNEEYD